MTIKTGLTLVPSRQIFRPQGPLKRLIFLKDLPPGFGVFPVVRFVAAKELQGPKRAILLRRAIKLYKELYAQNCEHLLIFADSMRREGVKFVVFTFEFNGRTCSLCIRGKGPGTQQHITYLHLFDLQIPSINS